MVTKASFKSGSKTCARKKMTALRADALHWAHSFFIEFELLLDDNQIKTNQK